MTFAGFGVAAKVERVDDRGSQYVIANNRQPSQN